MEPKKVMIGDFEFTLIDLGHVKPKCDCHACQGKNAVVRTMDHLMDADPATLLLLAEEIGAFVSHLRRVMDAANRHRIPWLRAAFVGSQPLTPTSIGQWERMAFFCDYLGQRGLTFKGSEAVHDEMTVAMEAKFGK